MAQPQGKSSTDGGRIDGTLGTAAVAGDFVLGAGWGSTRSATVTAGSNAQRGKLTLTASGSSYAQATATVVFTFPDGAYNVAPPCGIVTVTSDSSIDEGHVTVVNTTTTSTWTFSVLPVSTKIYVFHYLIPA